MSVKDLQLVICQLVSKGHSKECARLIVRYFVSKYDCKDIAKENNSFHCNKKLKHADNIMFNNKHIKQ